jgi:DNA ligase (NAD+)
VRPVPGARTGDEVPFEFPDTCPACGTELVRLDEEADWYCMNTECPAQFRRLVEHFVMRNAMDVEGLGERVAHQLVNEGKIESLADLFRLTEDDLIPMEGFGEKSARNLVESLEAAKDRPLSRLLYALGIRHVGRTVAETIVEHFASIDAIAETTGDELVAIDGVGPVIAESVVDWFQVDENRALVRELKEVGVNTDRKPQEAPPESDEASDLPLAGKTLVLTGSLDTLTRSEAKDRISKAGGKVTSSVSGNTDYLVKGENPGSKYDEAVERGVEIIEGEAGLLALLNGSGS